MDRALPSPASHGISCRVSGILLPSRLSKRARLSRAVSESQLCPLEWPREGSPSDSSVSLSHSPSQCTVNRRARHRRRVLHVARPSWMRLRICTARSAPETEFPLPKTLLDESFPSKFETTQVIQAISS